MYEAGLLELYPGTKCNDPGCDHTFHDNEGFPLMYGELRDPFVFLPHSCDEWVIGGPSEIRALMADLQKALGKIEALAKEEV